METMDCCFLCLYSSKSTKVYFNKATDVIDLGVRGTREALRLTVHSKTSSHTIAPVTHGMETTKYEMGQFAVRGVSVNEK